MNGLDIAYRPDSFALAQAARRHRAECFSRMLDIAAGWVRAVASGFARHLAASVPSVALQRAATH